MREMLVAVAAMLCILALVNTAGLSLPPLGGGGQLTRCALIALEEANMLLIIILVILIFGSGYGGYRAGPGWGYYGGGGLSLLLTIVLVLLLLRVF
jgi:hypothetical protein